MSAAWETVTADQLRAGDIVRKPSTGTRCRVGRVEAQQDRVTLSLYYAARSCTAACTDRPARCSHYGTGGGESGGWPSATEFRRLVTARA